VIVDTLCLHFECNEVETHTRNLGFRTINK